MAMWKIGLLALGLFLGGAGAAGAYAWHAQSGSAGCPCSADCPCD